MALEQVSFGIFRAYHGSADKIPACSFVLLDEPMEISLYLGGKMWVFALAWTNSRDAELEGITYALGIRPTVRGDELWVTRVAGDPVNRIWPGDTNYVHRDWVKAWISTHPRELVFGSMMVGRELGRWDYRLTELDILSVYRTGDIPTLIAKESMLEPLGMQSGDYHFRLVIFARKIRSYKNTLGDASCFLEIETTSYVTPSGTAFRYSRWTTSGGLDSMITSISTSVRLIK